MILLSVFSWWYGQGLKGQAGRISARLDRLIEFFSIGLLARTLFDPFKQIDANASADGSVNLKLHAWFDRLFSRIMGAIVRSFSIGIGLLCMFLVGVFGLVQLLVWPLVPFLPLIGLVMFIGGWTP